VNYKLQVTRAVSKLIGTAGLTRSETVRLLAWLHDDLPGRAEECRHIRASDADGCFTYEVNLEAEDRKHIIRRRFVVNDDRAADGLLVAQAFTFQRRPRTGGAAGP
jgi:hypothetical protein